MEIVGVSLLTRYLRELLDGDFRLQMVWVEGEVSNFRRSPTGHCYFTLKDETAQLRCAWFGGQIPLGAFMPRDGDHVIAQGRVSVYEQRGEYQLYVNVVRPAGAGALNQRFEELRARLDTEGLFDEARKRPLPRFPSVVGLVTSPVGAALRDVVNVLSRRFPAVRLVLAPTQVQGDGAAPRIAEAIALLDAAVCPDVIVVARGGGSLEDLWPFNEEVVARAIYACRTPVVSGVGHDTDVTIADLVADLRAPTPSAAAELVVPDVRECLEQVFACRERLQVLMAECIEEARGQLVEGERRLRRLSPAARLADRRQGVDVLAERAEARLRYALALRRGALEGRAAQLGALSPLAVLRRGYSITRNKRTGRVVRSVLEVFPGAALDVQVADGAFPATVHKTAWAQVAIPLEGAERG